VQTHLPDVIIDVAAQLEFQYKKRGQTVVMELDDDLPPVNVDIDRMVQVIINLMGNAIKFSPQGSLIRVHTQVVNTLTDLPPSAPSDVPLPGILVRTKGRALPKRMSRRFLRHFSVPNGRCNSRSREPG
jgi:signal transduction histidine kinase